MSKIISILLVGGLFCGVIAAEKAVTPKNFAEIAAATQAEITTKKVSPNQGKEANNTCPVCGRERSVCYEESLKATQNSGGGAKLCPVYKDSFIVGESRPHPCPICGLTVNLPQRNQRYENTDSDLCPHPCGNVRYMPEITTCPRCGFSAFQKDFRNFRAKQHPQLVKWIKENLQPRMLETLHQLLGKEIKIDDKNLVALFELQKEIPDILRCGNAFLIYRQRLLAGDSEVSSAGLARAAWLAAWANRRAVSAPVGEGILLDGARKISAAVKKAEYSDNELEENIAFIRQLLGDKEKFDILEQQLLRIELAGYCNRLGLNAWAELSLKQVLQEINKKHRDPGADLWQRVGVANGLKGEEKEKVIELAKKALADEVAVRLNCLTQENNYLNEAVKLITTALEKREIPALALPTYLYLVGDFERRREQPARGLLWLTAAGKAADSGAEIKLEHCAPLQIDLLKRYVRDQKITPAPNAFAESDTKIINAAGMLAKQAQAQELAKTQKSTTPATVKK